MVVCTPKRRSSQNLDGFRSLLEFVGDGESGLLGYIKNTRGRGMEDSSSYVCYVVECEIGRCSEITERRASKVLSFGKGSGPLMLRISKQPTIFSEN